MGDHHRVLRESARSCNMYRHLGTVEKKLRHLRHSAESVGSFAIASILAAPGHYAEQAFFATTGAQPLDLFACSGRC